MDEIEVGPAYASGDGITFYVDPVRKEIVKRMSEIGIAETTYVYGIRRCRDGFDFFSDRHCDIGDACSDHHEELGFAGNTEEEALRFVIEALVAPFREKSPYMFKVNSDLAKTCMEAALLAGGIVSKNGILFSKVDNGAVLSIPIETLRLVGGKKAVDKFYRSAFDEYPLNDETDEVYHVIKFPEDIDRRQIQKLVDMIETRLTGGKRTWIIEL